MGAEGKRCYEEESILICDVQDNPRNWSKGRKWYITCLVCMSNVLTCVCAGSWSSGANYAAADFGVSAEVSTLGMFVDVRLSKLANITQRAVYVHSRFRLRTTTTGTAI